MSFLEAHPTTVTLLCALIAVVSGLIGHVLAGKWKKQEQATDDFEAIVEGLRAELKEVRTSLADERTQRESLSMRVGELQTKMEALEAEYAVVKLRLVRTQDTLRQFMAWSGVGEPPIVPPDVQSWLSEGGSG